MNAPQVHYLDGYTLRQTVRADLPLVRAWNALDADHAWEWDRPDYWIEQTQYVNTYALEDRDGVIFFLRLTRLIGGRQSVEIAMQFNRGGQDRVPLRTVIALRKGFAWLKEALAANGFEAVYFTSRSPRLILFAKHRLGFVQVEADRVSEAAGFERFCCRIPKERMKA